MVSLESKNQTLLIAVTGPECSGKTFLTKHLANYYEGCRVAEVAREFLPALGRKYQFDDLLHLSRMQLAEEEKTIAACKGKTIFFDTELINIKIWSEYRFGKVHEEIVRNIKNSTYDFYLLMYPDIPWEYDLLRENPNDRLELFERFEKELKLFGKTYYIIRGELQKRTCDAIYKIEKFKKNLR